MKNKVLIIGDTKNVNYTRIQFYEFKGREYIDIRRIWNNNGEHIPTKKGISFLPEELPTIIAALQEIQSGIDE